MRAGTWAGRSSARSSRRAARRSSHKSLAWPTAPASIPCRAGARLPVSKTVATFVRFHARLTSCHALLAHLQPLRHAQSFHAALRDIMCHGPAYAIVLAHKRIPLSALLLSADKHHSFASSSRDVPDTGSRAACPLVCTRIERCSAESIALQVAAALVRCGCHIAYCCRSLLHLANERARVRAIEAPAVHAVG